MRRRFNMVMYPLHRIIGLANSTPKVRFKIFNKEWSYSTFGDEYIFKRTNSFSRDCLNYKNGALKNIHYGDIHTKFSKYFEVTKEDVPYIDENVNLKGIIEDHFCKEGDLVLADASEDYADLGSTIEMIDISNQNIVAGLHTYLARRKNDDTIYKGFACYLMQSFRIRKQIMILGQGTKVYGISKGSLSKIILHLPSLSEQQKIADFLSSVDKKIEQLTRKKELLEKYKTGMMQKLFPKAGEQHPELRFKDENGQDFPDWEIRTLGKLGEFKTSSVDKKITDGETRVYLVNYMNVYRHEIITSENKNLLMEVSAKDTQIQNLNLLKGDILFTPSSETPEDIGHSVVIKEDLSGTLFSYHLMRFRPRVKLGLTYSHYFCNTPNVLRQISGYATGSTRFTISVGSFSKVKVSLPCYSEQQKIADFLSAIDDKITKVEGKLTKAQTFKKGLLQQMFV